MAQGPFISEQFLLDTDAAHRLYHEYAAGLPIIDYHCHLPPNQIARNHQFRNLTELWLNDDHYKWRAMRSNGVPERLCTGDASDREKFNAWAASMPKLLRNPIYHWTHLELARTFGVDDLLLSPDTADEIWDRCNARLAEPDFSCRGLMKQANVILVCTTDDPVDDLAHHRTIADDASFDIQILPTWRPDQGMAIENPTTFNAWLDRLGRAADTNITDFDSYLSALRIRHHAFHAIGCRLSDHGLETIDAVDCSHREAQRIFAALRSGSPLTSGDDARFKSAMLYEFGVMDHEKDWTQQYHIGPLRNCNTRLHQSFGPDAGCDSISDQPIARPLARLLDRLDETNQLARTILYNLNPRDNAVIASMIGNFQDGSIPGKIQFGSAWWFLDQLDGMAAHINTLSQMSLLSRFVGMLTDSRSFTSYARHEYFRRILCNILGDDMTRGLIPSDFDLIGGMVRDICYSNAAGYFGFNVPPAP